jgi:FAD/FMN-containing dehydrogenase
MTQLIKDMARIVGEAGVLSASRDLEAYVSDCRGRSKGSALCVVRPASVEEIAAVVAKCLEHGVPIQPQGGNTSLCGGSVPLEGERGVILSLARMRRIREIDTANNSITVDAGCVLADVQRAALDAGRLYPVSLGAEGSCQIGGNIATNAGGTGVLRYGSTRDNVLGLEVVLSDASIWHGLRGLRKDNTGFDLKHLFIGSEGVLGIISAATLKLHPLDTQQFTTWLAPASLDAAVELLALFQSVLGPYLSAFEIMNSAQVKNVLAHVSDRQSPLDSSHPWHLIAELGANTDIRPDLERVLEKAISSRLLIDAALAASEAQRAAIWKVRHSVVEANNKAGRRIVHDIAVPLSRIPEFVRRASAAVAERYPKVQIVIVGHIGDGNLHFSPMFDFETWNAFADPEVVIEEVRRLTHDTAMALGGSFSAEHGVGRDMLAEMRRYKSPVELSLMRSIKRALDPHGLFNPGKVIPETD